MNNRQLIIKMLTLLTLWSGVCLSSADATVVNSLLNNSSPNWNRISDRAGNPDSANDYLPYQVLEIRSATGAALTATMGASTQFDSFLALYSSSNLSNLHAADDDSGGYPLAQLSNVPLSANVSYYLVVTSYSNQADSVYPLYGNYALTLNGDLRVVSPSFPPVLGGTFTTSGTVNDNATIAPFSGVAVDDPNADTINISISYTAANGTLTGAGLSGAAGNYTLTGANPATVTSRLQGLVFHPAANQVAPGSTVVTTFNLTPNDGTVSGTANSTTKVTATSINDAPVNSVLPVVSGTAAVGKVFSATSGTWSDVDPGSSLTYSYRWQRADSNTGLNAADIAGANTSNHTLIPADYLKYLRVVVTANDGQGSSTQTAASAWSSRITYAPTDITLSSSSVAEDSPADTDIGALTTEDPDAGDTFTYSLETGVAGCADADNASFNINAASLRGSVVPDFEVKNSYQICVRSTDGAGLTYDKTLTIAVTDLCTLPNGTVTDAGDSGAGTLRDMLENVCSGGVIDFAPAVNTITLTSGTLNVGKNFTIAGPGAAKLTIDGNSAARIFQVNNTTSLVLKDLTLTKGAAIGGGALADNSATNTTISGCIFSSNESMGGGAILSQGTMTISNSTFNGNAASFAGNGGAIYAVSGAMSINSSTFSGNSAALGAAIANSSATLSLINVTVSGNSASTLGGGIMAGGGTTTLKNSLVADNTGTGGGPDIFGTVVSQGYNLIRTTTDATIDGTLTGNITGQDPKLGFLADNGGPTQTISLLTGSPAIDAIPGCNGAPAVDQRGVPRPQGTSCDMGAYELDITPPAVTVNQAVGQADPVNSSPIIFTVVFSEPVIDFSNTSVTLSGTAGATTALVTGSGAIYSVAVSGMTGDGTVIASIAAGAVHDTALNGNSASTATDNSVTFDSTPPTATINQAVGQADPVNAGPMLFSVVFSEPVADFINSDVTLGGTAGATTAVVSGGPTTYNVTVSGMTANGTISASLAAGVAHDAAGNASLASTSTDNTVTLDNVAPDTGITGSPSNPQVGVNVVSTFQFSGSDTGGSGVAGFECQIDSSGWESCVSPKSYAGLSAGSGGHTFTVRSVDNAGNRDATPASMSWEVIPSLGVTAIVLDGSITYAAQDGSGIWKSGNGGVTWTAAATQPANQRIKGLVIKPEDSTTLYAASYGDGLFKSVNVSGDSANNGSAWSQCNNTGLSGVGLNIVCLAIDKNGVLYAGAEAGIFTSSDCVNWSALNTGLIVDATKPPVAIVIDPADVAKLYAGLDGAGVFKSIDNGATWTAAATQPANKRIKALAINKSDSTKLYAATYGGGVFKSVNSGADWSACANTNLTNLNIVSLTIDTTGKLYAGTEAGVFVSADACGTWTAMNSGLP